MDSRKAYLHILVRAARQAPADAAQSAQADILHIAKILIEQRVPKSGIRVEKMDSWQQYRRDPRSRRNIPTDYVVTRNLEVTLADVATLGTVVRALMSKARDQIFQLSIDVVEV